MTAWERDSELEDMTEQARREAIKKLPRDEIRRILKADFFHKTIKSIRDTLHELHWSDQDGTTNGRTEATACGP